MKMTMVGAKAKITAFWSKANGKEGTFKRNYARNEKITWVFDVEGNEVEVLADGFEWL